MKPSSMKPHKPATNNGSDQAPGKKHFIVVCYDITDDKRRSRLYRRLHKFGIGVQYSVFECLLNKSRFTEMKKMVKETIKTQKGDRIRYYVLCDTCRNRVQATDGVVDQDVPVIFV
jgi:CRISPR-associated protein Cas2